MAARMRLRPRRRLQSSSPRTVPGRRATASGPTSPVQNAESNGMFTSVSPIRARRRKSRMPFRADLPSSHLRLLHLWAGRGLGRPTLYRPGMRRRRRKLCPARPRRHPPARPRPRPRATLRRPSRSRVPRTATDPRRLFGPARWVSMHALRVFCRSIADRIPLQLRDCDVNRPPG